MSVSRLVGILSWLATFIIVALIPQSNPALAAPPTRGDRRPAADQELVLQIDSIRGIYGQGDDIDISGSLSSDGVVAVGAGICYRVFSEEDEELWGACSLTDNEGGFAQPLRYGEAIPTGYLGTLKLSVCGLYEDQEICKSTTVQYGLANDDEPDEPPPDEAPLPLDLELIGPEAPIEIGGWDDIGIAGSVSSSGDPVNGATVTMVVAGQTFETTTGTHTPGGFNWYWANDAFPAGNYVVQVTVAKAGYESATGTIPFTLLGAGYDYWVTMDPIPSPMTPGGPVSFPGRLTLGGEPVSDWIEITLTMPDGTTKGYSTVTGDDGRFIHTEPALTLPGTYQLAIFALDADKQISETYTFEVAPPPTETLEPPTSDDVTPTVDPTVTPSIDQPPPEPQDCTIVDVVYPDKVAIGTATTVTGRVVCTDEDDTALPQPGWGVQQDQFSDQTPKRAETGADGAFTFNFTANSFAVPQLSLVAWDQESGRKAYWSGPLRVTAGLAPAITLSQSNYDGGEPVEGTLALRPSWAAPENWHAGLRVVYEVTGPTEGTPQQYKFEAQADSLNLQYHDSASAGLEWTPPPEAAGGTYDVTARITGDYVDAEAPTESFQINSTQYAELTAELRPDPEGWHSAQLGGEYTDAEGMPIAGVSIRATFSCAAADDAEAREFQLQGTTDATGGYEIDLRPLDIFVGQGYKKPVYPDCQAVVRANKEDYAVGQTTLQFVAPTVEQRIEILSTNPPLDHLTKLAQGGINYEHKTDIAVQVDARYNHLFDDELKLETTVEGLFAPDCSRTQVLDDGYFHSAFHLSIDGEVVPETKEVPTYGLTPQQARRWWVLGAHANPLYWYPTHSITRTATDGFAQDTSVAVTGKLFGYRYPFSTVNECGSGTYGHEPPDPPPWIGPVPAITIEVCLGRSCDRVTYNLTPPPTTDDKGDLAITKVVLLQAVEGGTLVQGRPVGLRVFCDWDGPDPAEVAVTATVDGKPLPAVHGQVKTTYTDRDKSSGRDAINIVLPADFFPWLGGDSHHLSVEVKLLNATDTDASNNAHQQSFETVYAYIPEILFVSLDPSIDYRQLMGFANRSKRYLDQVYPVPHVDIIPSTYRGHIDTFTGFMGAARTVEKARQVYNAERCLSPDGQPTPDCTAPYAGVAVGAFPQGRFGADKEGFLFGNGGNAATDVLQGMALGGTIHCAALCNVRNPNNVAHELGHHYGLRDEYGDGSTGIPIEAGISTWEDGFFITQNPGSRLQPAPTYNFMGNVGVGRYWVNADTWNTLLGHTGLGQSHSSPAILPPTLASAGAVGVQMNPMPMARNISEIEAPALLVEGMIDGESATLDDVRALSRYEDLSLAPGDWSVVALDAAGGVLGEVAFAPLQHYDSPLTPLLIPVPVSSFEALSEVQIRRAGQVVDTHGRSSAAPVVELGPLPDLSDEAPALNWQAVDDDADALVYDVTYTVDDGQTWQTLALGITETVLTLDPETLSGGSAHFQVIASDGFNTGRATSEPLTIPDHGPVAEISAPWGDTFAKDEPVTLSGLGYDVEDGLLTGNALRWTDASGEIVSYGGYLFLPGWGVGEETFTFTAEDASGRTAEATFIIHVEDTADATNDTGDTGNFGEDKTERPETASEVRRAWLIAVGIAIGVAVVSMGGLVLVLVGVVVKRRRRARR